MSTGGVHSPEQVSDAAAATRMRSLLRRVSARLGLTDPVVTVVTSRWHAFRARALVRAALRDPGVSVRSSSPPGRPPLALLAREAVCFAALPYQLVALRRYSV